MPSLDIFNSDAFTWTSLTDAVNKRPFMPGRLGQLGLFGARGISTTTLYVEEKSGVLSLVQTSARGAPAAAVGSAMRVARPFRVPHLVQQATINADEVQNVRVFGSESEVQTVQTLVDERTGELQDNIAVTQEYHRMGAVQGVILDADGSTIYNLFTEFGVAQQTYELDLNDIADPPETALINQIVAAKRLAEAELGAIVINGWRAFVGKDVFDGLVAHPSVRRAYDTQQGLHLGQDLRYVGFTWGGVTFEEYRGSVTPQAGGSAVQFVADAQGWLVPETTPSIFVTRFAPADYEETVNTIGLPFYAKQAPDPSGFNRHRAIEVQSNPISLCLRPRAVIKLTLAA